MRDVFIELKQSLYKEITYTTLLRCAKSLGCEDEAWLTGCQPTELFALSEFVLHRFSRLGKNLIQRRLASKSAPSPESDRGSVLLALREARFSIFTAEDIREGLGVVLCDVLRGEMAFVIDEAMDGTIVPQAIMCGRLLKLEDVTFCAGSMLPLSLDTLLLALRSFDPEFDPARRILSCRELDCLEEENLEGFTLSMQFLANAGGLGKFEIADMLDQIDEAARLKKRN
ncbi:MAG: hypothetical protein BroJett014_22100 [Planctomycetota bacterium]|nr:MAG: hypothetical protein BroJett014_22100 [Planctomycetota bacterium]